MSESVDAEAYNPVEIINRMIKYFVLQIALIIITVSLIDGYGRFPVAS